MNFRGIIVNIKQIKYFQETAYVSELERKPFELLSSHG